MASVSALVDVSATEPEDWTYVAEGGASLVVRYSGTPNPTFTGRVLRIRKCSLGAAVSTTLADGIEQEIIHFQGDIVTRLLPSGSVPLLVLALVEPPWLDALAKRVEGERPPARQAIDRIDSSRPYAILAPNLIDPAGISVEIKPKWGFLPNSSHLSPETRLIKTQTCRFCMHAHMRTSLGQRWMTVSYCPLDLYSGNPERVKTAINALWEDWKSTSGTFNNLRIYLDGKLLHPNDDLTPLLSRMPEEYSKDGSTTVHDAFAAYIASILLGSGVLPSLSRLQRTLDELNIEGLETLLGRFQSPEKSDDISPTVRDLLRQATVDEWAAFTALYEDRIMDEEPTPADLSALTASDARYWVLSCLLSGTFKDCSLMISSTDHAVRVIDMDPKLTSKLPGWAKLDSQIVETYAALPAEKRKRCVDAQLPQHVYEEERPVRRMMMLKDLGTFPFLMAITAIFIALSVILPALPFRK